MHSSSTHPLTRLLSRDVKQVLGLMSGTSVDGLDCALVTVRGHGPATEVLAVRSSTYEYSPAVRQRIHSWFRPETGVQTLCEASFWLAEHFAALSLRFLAELGVAPAEVDLIGSHGQTVWHQPPSACRAGSTGEATPSTLQIGEPAVLAARTGIVTLADFRVADVALGGEGAPLVPFCDWLLFRQPGVRRALQNIGGIANTSILQDDPAAVLAFDNGPGNMLIDALAPAAAPPDQPLSLDLDGQLSARGRVVPGLLAELLDDDYLRQVPPKSTGRERYGRAFAARLQARHANIPPVDLLATAVAFTAQAIADSLRPFSVSEVLVSGGGAHNRTLMRELAARMAPTPVQPLSRIAAPLGIDEDNKEAVAFALLAVQALHGAPANLPSVTGARGHAILGKICLPPWGPV